MRNIQVKMDKLSKLMLIKVDKNEDDFCYTYKFTLGHEKTHYKFKAVSIIPVNLLSKVIHNGATSVAPTLKGTWIIQVFSSDQELVKLATKFVKEYYYENGDMAQEVADFIDVEDE